jgi:hypothetical protein
MLDAGMCFSSFLIVHRHQPRIPGGTRPEYVLPRRCPIKQGPISPVSGIRVGIVPKEQLYYFSPSTLRYVDDSNPKAPTLLDYLISPFSSVPPSGMCSIIFYRH